MGRAFASIFALAITAAAPSVANSIAPTLEHYQVFAQTPPIPLPGPLASLLANPAGWLVDTFNAALAQLSSRATFQALDLVNWLLGSNNIVTLTPPALTYDSPVVIDLWNLVLRFAVGGLAAVTAWLGLNAMLRPHLRAPYHGVLEALPRLVLTAILMNFSLGWCHFAIDLNNALCQELGAHSFPAWNPTSGQPDDKNVLLNLVAVGIYLLMGMLLFSQMMMRVALVDVLLIIAPLAILCWTLPQTYGWARLWFSTFFATVFVQFIQVLVLRLGADLITHLPQVFGSGSNPIDAGRLWLVTLLLGMAVLQLARKIPRLMPGYATGAVLTHDSPIALLRGIQQLMPARSSGGGRRS